MSRLALAGTILDEIHAATTFLIGSGLADDANAAFYSEHVDDVALVHYSNAPDYADALKGRPYQDTYDDQKAKRAFTVRMLDGALVQMVYEFKKSKLRRARLAFLPSPYLLEFQNHAELYLEDALYGDVVQAGVVAVPLRFDFDARPQVVRELVHPASHLTLGQYAECRIPATGPVMPLHFTDFFLRSFYNRAVKSVTSDLPAQRHRVVKTISSAELEVIHVGVPCSPN